jgi:hypothetical protein
MGTVTVPASGGEALAKLMSLAGYLADLDAAQLPAEVLGQYIRDLVQADAVLTAALAPMLAAYDAKDGHLADGQRSLGAWLVHMARVTRGQAAEFKAIRALPRDHQPLLAGLRTRAVTTSEALQLAKWTREIPAEFRGQAEEILVAAARAGADLRALAQICAEIRSRTVPPNLDGNDPALDRALFLDTTLDGAGVLRGDLTPECAAMVQAVLDALSAPAGAGDLRTQAQRYHDALAEAMKRLLASNLLPQRAGQPVKALVHMSFADLCDLDADSKLQEAWIGEYRARWAGQRAAASVSTGDGGAWLDGDAARRVACDAMLIPVVTGDLDPGALEVLIDLCVKYDHLRRQASAGPGQDSAQVPGQVEQGDRAAQVLAMLEHQILATVLQIVSGPGGVASFLRRNLLGKGLNGPSLPLDVGQTDDIPSTCGGWWPCGTRPASSPAAATSPHPAANPTTWCTARTAGTRAWRT